MTLGILNRRDNLSVDAKRRPVLEASELLVRATTDVSNRVVSGRDPHPKLRQETRQEPLAASKKRVESARKHPTPKLATIQAQRQGQPHRRFCSVASATPVVLVSL